MDRSTKSISRLASRALLAFALIFAFARPAKASGGPTTCHQLFSDVFTHELTVENDWQAYRALLRQTELDPGVIRTLVNDNGPASFKRVFKYIVDQPNLSSLQRAALFGRFAPVIEESSVDGFSWAADTIQTDDGSIGFVGAFNYLLVFSKDGRVYMGRAPLSVKLQDLHSFDYRLLPVTP